KLSFSVVAHVRTTLRGFYRHLIETKVFAGPNPAGDLGYFVGRMRRGKRYDFFTPEEGQTLLDAARTFEPYYTTLILTALKTGLRFGELAGLRKADIDFRRGFIHVQRSYSSKAREMHDTPKDKEARYVKATKEVLEALRTQIETVDFEASAGKWD